MVAAWLSVSGLALLAVCGAAIARPAEETERTGDEIVWDTLFDTCPHPESSNVTAQQAQGVWYLLEMLRPAVGSEQPRVSRELPCVRCNFTFDSTRLSLSASIDGEEEQEQTWTYNLSPSGVWENAVSLMFLRLGMSADGQLLLACFTSGDGVSPLALALGRSPNVDEDTVAAARSQISSVGIRPRHETCGALPTTDALLVS